MTTCKTFGQAALAFYVQRAREYNRDAVALRKAGFKLNSDMHFVIAKQHLLRARVSKMETLENFEPDYSQYMTD